MECDTPIDDYCEAWEAPYLRTPQLLLQSSSSTTHHQFFIRIDLEFLRPSANATDDDDDDDEDDEDFDPNCFESITKTEHFWAPCNRLDPDNKLPHDLVSGVLSGMGIPSDRQPFLLQRISDCANEIANAAHNERENILPIVVSASVLVPSFLDQQPANA